MVLKKQTVWLLSMLTVMVVLSAYYLIQGPVEQVPVASEMKQGEQNLETEVDSKQVMENAQVVTGGSDYFLEVKMNRDAWNGQRMEEYMSIMTNPDASSEAIAEAKNSYDELLSEQDSEMNVENLIKALGYEEAVIISQDNRVNVIVQAQKMEPKQVVEIMSLVTQHMEVPGKNIVVSYKN